MDSVEGVVDRVDRGTVQGKVDCGNSGEVGIACLAVWIVGHG